AEAVALQIAWALVGEEYVGILQQAIEFCAIVLGIVQDRRTHTNLYVPRKGLDLRIVWSPDVKDIGPIAGEISPYAGSCDHVPHSKCANAIKRALSTFLETYWIAFADLLHANQWHAGEDLDVLRLPPEFFEGAHHGDGKPGLSCGVLQVFGTPLQNSVAHRIG